MDPGFLCLGGWFEVVRKWNYAGSSVTRVDAVGAQLPYAEVRVSLCPLYRPYLSLEILSLVMCIAFGAWTHWGFVIFESGPS